MAGISRILFSLVIMALCFGTATGADPAPAAKDVSVVFSPKGGCVAALVAGIATAKKSIRVQAYSFTHPDIYQALIAAHKRGVDVQVILDRSYLSSAPGAANALRQAEVAVLIDSKHQIAHNKVTIIDDTAVFTGSFNYTRQAESSNAENLITITARDVVLQFFNNWESHAGHSKPLP